MVLLDPWQGNDSTGLKPRSHFQVNSDRLTGLCFSTNSVIFIAKFCFMANQNFLLGLTTASASKDFIIQRTIRNLLPCILCISTNNLEQHACTKRNSWRLVDSKCSSWCPTNSTTSYRHLASIRFYVPCRITINYIE